MEPAVESPLGRTALLVGTEALERLKNARVFIFGLGGVGSYAAEAIVRAGVGHVSLVDFDTVTPSNLNRQLVALHSTIGLPKTQVARARYLDINPDARIDLHECFASEENLSELLGTGPASVIDAIDSVSAKVALLAAVHGRGWPVVSCMGAANRIDPTGIGVDDIENTRDCPLARRIRRRLRKAGVERGLRCVYTRENQNIVLEADAPQGRRKQRIQGSISYVPGIIGLTAAGLIIQDLMRGGGAP